MCETYQYEFMCQTIESCVQTYQYLCNSVGGR
jgi:hypothetical protein